MKYLDCTLPTPAENLALDEALLEAAEGGASGEVLRFWESPQPFVVLGYANRVATEVNLSACQAAGVPVMRRSSGGGTVLQGPGCLNFALVLGITEAPPLNAITATNQFIMSRHREMFRKLLPGTVEVNGHTDLTLDGAKFSGNAQRRKRQFLLFHGTFLLGFDLAAVGKFLPMPTHQPPYRQNRPHREFLTNLEVPSLIVQQALRSAWQAEEPSTEIPSREIAHLVAGKYARSQWNLKF